MRLKKSSLPSLAATDPELLVTQFIATRQGDAERGPKVWLSPPDARIRLLVDGELAWIRGPRGQQLATMQIDERVMHHTCIVRDLVGVSAAENVRVSKPDLDSPRQILA